MLLQELTKYIGQTVTVFTTSGGASGFGFTGVLLRVNQNFITLVNRIGAPPANPLGELYLCDSQSCGVLEYLPVIIVSSLCDIPVNKIVAFCHNSN